jgi:hypothetical protein
MVIHLHYIKVLISRFSTLAVIAMISVQKESRFSGEVWCRRTSRDCRESELELEIDTIVRWSLPF